MTETRTGDVEPRTAAGRRLLNEVLPDHAPWFVGGSLVNERAAILAIEEEARRLALAEGLDVEALADALQAEFEDEVGDMEHDLWLVSARNIAAALSTTTPEATE